MRVEDHGAEVLGIDARGSPRSAASSIRDAAAVHCRGGRERREPAVAEPADTAQLRRRLAAEPHVKALRRLRQYVHALVVEPRAVVVDGVLAPQAAEQRERLVEDRGAIATRDAERLLLDRMRDAESERRERAAAGEDVERRPLLRDERGAAPREHQHARAELDAFCVRAAANVEAEHGSGAGPLMRSDSHSESKPWCSSALGERAERARRRAGGGCPSP